MWQNSEQQDQKVAVFCADNIAFASVGPGYGLLAYREIVNVLCSLLWEIIMLESIIIILLVFYCGSKAKWRGKKMK